MARLFAWVLAVLWVVAWWSWGIQVVPLLGEGGVYGLRQNLAAATDPALAGASQALLPAAWLSARLLPYFSAPAGDWLLMATVAAGVLFATAAAIGLRTRFSLAMTALLYGAFVAATPAFFPTMGDRLLLEATLVAVALPRDRAAPLLHLLARLTVIKLYLSMGLAQWLALDNGWQRGWALRELLQNTALPTRSGWYVAHLPGPLVSGATKAALLLQLSLPWLAFGPRAMRLLVAVVLTALQVVVVSLVNDGLFSFVAVAMHLFLLDDGEIAAMEADVGTLGKGLQRLFAGITAPNVLAPPWRARAGEFVASGVLASYLLVATAATIAALGAPLGPEASPWRRMGAFTYAHAGASSGGRIEPIFEVKGDNKWQVLELWHQPGDPWRAPDLVLPHHPRLDAQLSAAGRAHADPSRQRVVHGLMHRLCRPGQNLQRLLRTPLPAKVQAVRVHYDSYSFADWAQHQKTGVWWTRALVADGPYVDCAVAAADTAAGSPAPATMVPAPAEAAE